VSFIRFGERGSDVYVFESTSSVYECCDCDLDPRRDRRHHTPSAAAMAEHLREHLRAGDVVPDGVIEAVLANGDIVPGHPVAGP